MYRISFLFVVSLLLTGCLQPQLLEGSQSFLPVDALQANSAHAEARFQPGDCPMELPAQEAQHLSVECGLLEVPENRADPAGRSIKLAVAILRHPGGAPEADPIVYLVGGPGGSILEIVDESGVSSAFGPILGANRDIILFDQRGVGFSEPALDCPDFAQLYLDLLDFEVDGQFMDGAARLETKVEALWSCAETLAAKADLSAYNSAASAADVADLRRALGYDKVNLWGASYGARLALEVLRRHPEAVRSVIVEATYPPEADLFVETPADFARALDVLFKACGADPACNEAYPDLAQHLFETVDRLNTEPARVQVAHPFSGQEYEMVIDGDTLLELIFRALYDSVMRPILPRAIVAAGENRFDMLLPVAAIDVWRQDMRSWGMYMSVLCSEEIPFSSAAKFAEHLAEYPQLAGMFQDFEVGELTYQTCERWGAGQADAMANEAVYSDVPVLLLAGEYDPITPPAWARQVADSLSNGHFFQFAGLGHGVSGANCAQRMMLQFLDQPDSEPDAACMDEFAVTPFALPHADDEFTLTPYESQQFGFSSLRPAGWTEIAPGVFNRGQGATDVARLIQQAAPGASVERIEAALAAQLGVDELPESTGTVEGGPMTWALYRAEVEAPAVGTVIVDIALAEGDTGTVLVLLQSLGDERDSLVDGILLPVLAELSLISTS